MASISTDRRPTAPQERQDLQQNRVPNEQTSDLFSQPSSSTNGFFQSPPQVLNQLYDDVALQRALGLFLPSSVRHGIIPELASFGDKVLSREVLHLIADAEKNPPYLRTWDTWGKRRDELVTSEGWRKLQDLGIEEGMVSIGYENENAQYSRVHHFAKYHLWCGSSAWVNCPSLMTDGAASLLRTHLSSPDLPRQQRSVFQSAFDRLTSRDSTVAWTTGQWMTERAGGSDVSQTETLATYSPDDSSSGAKALSTDGENLGPWLINGFKWFSSATDSSMMVLLARTPKGISAFYAPMRRTLPAGPDSMGYTTELNGIQIQRLKQKLGTRALPTAELELKGIRAYLIGEEGRGTKEIATVLNIARIHNAVSAVGFWGRGLGISRAFARCRKVGQKPLHGKASHIRTLAKMHAEYRANMLFTFFVSALLGVVEQSQHAAYEGSQTKAAEPSLTVPNPSTVEHLLRLLTPVVKGVTAKKAIAGLAECMESLGGVGYLENEDMQFNIARLYRDANVLSIWEGTTDMMAHDVLRVVYGKTSQNVMSALDEWVSSLLGTESGLGEQGLIVEGWWKSFKSTAEKSEKEEMEMISREMMEKLADVVMGVLLVVDVRRDGDKVAGEIAEMWIAERDGRNVTAAENGRWQNKAARDRRIVFGAEDLPGAKAKL